MSGVFARNKVQHIIRDGRIFTKGEGLVGGRTETIEEIEDNSQSKVVSDIAFGVTIDDVYFPPPSALAAAITASADRFGGPYPRLDANGQPVGGPDERFEDCDLMRAAILKQP
jgi:hypothetical protein